LSVAARQRKLHKAFLRYHDPENWPLLREALKEHGPRRPDRQRQAPSGDLHRAHPPDGTLERLEDRYFGHVHRLSAEDIERFLEKMHNVLPRYRRHFIDAQEIHGIDWRLLAALAYQESQWDPLATSYTNVRGMMMLTEDTADRLRVTTGSIRARASSPARAISPS
jgi:membrane-bound lytic murein transglycosylase MltF